MIRIINISKSIVILICIFFSFYATKFYYGSDTIFILFNFLILFLFYYLTSPNSSFFSVFLAFYLFMGFWFKYNLSLVYNNGLVYDSGIFYSNNIDKILLISIYLFLAIIFGNFFSIKYFSYNKLNFKTRINFFQSLYIANNKLILTIFVIMFLIVAATNFYNKIYIKGMIFENDYNFFLVNILKWLILFGFTTFSCLILKSEIIKKNKYITLIFLIVFLEIFCSYTSMLSRSMILFGLPFLYAIFFYDYLIKKTLLNYVIIFISYIILCISSLIISNEIRIDLSNKIETSFIKENEITPKSETIENYEPGMPYFNTKQNWDFYKFAGKPYNPSKITDKNSKEYMFSIDEYYSSEKMAFFILVNRWVGIDSLINIHNSKNLSFKLLLEALRENKDKFKTTFYEKNFNLESKKKTFYANNVIVKGNTLPGIFSFLYYSGSIIFLSLVSFSLIILFSFIEKKIFYISNKNLFFVSFLSHSIAFRLFNFGYAPKDTYLFVISLTLSVLLIYILESGKLLKLFKSFR